MIADSACTNSDRSLGAKEGTMDWSRCGGRFRVLDGVVPRSAHSRRKPPSTHNEINQIAQTCNKNNWLPTLDTFRTFAAQIPGCSNQVKSFVGTNIRVEMSLPSRLGAQSGQVSNTDPAMFTPSCSIPPWAVD